MKNRYLLIGDVHGQFSYLNGVVKRYGGQVDGIFQVGDMGFFNPADIDLLREPDHPVTFIEGNHDNPSLIKSSKSLLQYKGLIYKERGSYINLPNPCKVAFLGGGHSIDRHRRVEGRDWWREELPSYEEVSRFAEVASDADVVITHEAPVSILQAAGLRLYKDDPSPLARDLDFLFQRGDVCPKMWIFGHHHEEIIQECDNPHTLFLGLPCIEDDENRWALTVEEDGSVDIEALNTRNFS